MLVADSSVTVTQTTLYIAKCCRVIRRGARGGELTFSVTDSILKKKVTFLKGKEFKQAVILCLATNQLP